MLFNSFAYWLFFCVAYVALAAVSRRQGIALLVAFSYAFYAFWDYRFLALLALSTVFNYVLALRMERLEGRARRLLLGTAIAGNLLVLGFFKYYNFFVDSFAALFNAAPGGWTLNIVLPVGISFFTFEGIAYAVDVYRRDVPAQRNLIDHALFISFFPHLISGPIIRPAKFIPQLGGRTLAEADIRWGLVQIVKGLIKKLALADSCAAVADAYFTSLNVNTPAVAAWVGVLAFSLQIYFDFAGYTDIALGCARLLGYDLPPNFERPYLARNISEFWRRWHISLSTWLRDYLYIPLGGNRDGAAHSAIYVLIVMGLGGLWHGASWNFFVWGLLHGSFLVIHRVWQALVRRAGLARVTEWSGLQPMWTALTFYAVTLAWIPFRAPTLAATLQIASAMKDMPNVLDLEGAIPVLIVAGISLAFCLVDSGRRIQDWLIQRAPRLAFGTAFGFCLWGLELFARVDVKIPFIYFQF